MTNNSTLVFKGFLELTDEEREEVIDAINDFYKKDFSTKRNIQESLQEKTASIILGPTGGGCPCCGR